MFKNKSFCLQSILPKSVVIYRMEDSLKWLMMGFSGDAVGYWLLAVGQKLKAKNQEPKAKS